MLKETNTRIFIKKYLSIVFENKNSLNKILILQLVHYVLKKHSEFLVYKFVNFVINSLEYKTIDF